MHQSPTHVMPLAGHRAQRQNRPANQQSNQESCAGEQDGSWRLGKSSVNATRPVAVHLERAAPAIQIQLTLFLPFPPHFLIPLGPCHIQHKERIITSTVLSLNEIQKRLPKCQTLQTTKVSKCIAKHNLNCTFSQRTPKKGNNF